MRSRVEHLLKGLMPLCASVMLAQAIPAHAQNTQDTNNPARVAVAPLKEIALRVDRSIPATVLSLRRAVVAAELSARVIEFDLVPGMLVAKDETLARLNCQDSELALASARSALAALDARRQLATQQLGRLNKLRKSQNATEEQISQRAAELAVVKAETATQSIAIETAQRQVERCTIRAPFTGLVTEASGQLGNYLVPGSPVVTLVDIDRIELSAALLEAQVDELSTNVPRFAFGGKDWPLTVRTIFPVIDQATQTREIRFYFTADKPPPGAIGRLRWTLGGFTIPARFLVSRGNQIGVFVLEGIEPNTVRYQPIDGAQPGQPAAVDLSPDLIVITDGRFGLRDGQEVIVDQ